MIDKMPLNPIACEASSWEGVNATATPANKKLTTTAKTIKLFIGQFL